jgi:large subunit ribosomal protein L21
MYAVVETGGRQYRVQTGDTIDVERLAGEVGETVELSAVLMIGEGAEVTLGTPILDTARVTAEIMAHKRGTKITIFKFKRRKSYRRKQGHRQSLTALKITDIHASPEAMQASTQDAPTHAL